MVPFLIPTFALYFLSECQLSLTVVSVDQTTSCLPRRARQRVSRKSALLCLPSFILTSSTSNFFEAGNDNDFLDGLHIAVPEDRIKHLESQTQALEMQLAYRSEAAANAVAKCETIRIELADATEKYESEKKFSIDVARSMTRQYKGMQEDLLNKINDRERIIESLKDEIETLKALHKEQIAQKDCVIQRKDADAIKTRHETEEFVKFFANHLANLRVKIINNSS